MPLGRLPVGALDEAPSAAGEAPEALARQRTARWLLLGSLLAVAPVTAVISSPRLLGASMLGVAAVVALLLERAWLTPESTPEGGRRGWATEHTATAALALGFAHLVHAPVTSFLVAQRFRASASAFAEHSAGAAGAPRRARHRRARRRARHGRRALPAVARTGGRRCRRPGTSSPRRGTSSRLRVDARTVDLIAPMSHSVFSQGGGNLWRSETRKMPVGSVVQMPGMRVRVLEVGAEGPRRVRYELDRDLDAPSLLWISEGHAGGDFPEDHPPQPGLRQAVRPVTPDPAVAAPVPGSGEEPRAARLRRAFSLRRNLGFLFVPAEGHLRPLDGLRALSLLWVIVFHAGWYIGKAVPVATYTALVFSPWMLPVWRGDFGVDVFFVLSGFLIAGLLIDERARTGRLRLGLFYLRRLVRLWPALWVAVLADVILFGDHVDMVWANLFYVSNFVPILEAAMGWTWSLAIEEQFYLLCPWLVSTLAPLDGRSRVAVIAGIVALARGRGRRASSWPPISTPSTPRSWSAATGRSGPTATTTSTPSPGCAPGRCSWAWGRPTSSGCRA